MRGLMICTLHQKYLGDQIKKIEMGGSCSMWEVERSIQTFGEETVG
jgi:hypothetical protein